MGNIQHLKSRFGKGYTVELKTSKASQIPLLEHFIVTELCGTISESHQNWFKCSIAQGALSLAQVFRRIENMREEPSF